MNQLILACNKCGTSLSVPEQTRFLTCTACSSQLAVRFSEGAAYTEVLETGHDPKVENQEIDQGTTNRLTLQRKLDDLEQEWEEEKERHGAIPRVKRSQLYGGILGLTGFGMVVFSIWLHNLGSDVRLERMLHPWPWICTGLGIILVAAWIVFFLSTSAQRQRIAQYELAERSYDYRWGRLLDDIDACEENTRNEEEEKG